MRTGDQRNCKRANRYDLASTLLRDWSKVLVNEENANTEIMRTSLEAAKISQSEPCKCFLLLRVPQYVPSRRTDSFFAAFLRCCPYAAQLRFIALRTAPDVPLKYSDMKLLWTSSDRAHLSPLAACLCCAPVGSHTEQIDLTLQSTGIPFPDTSAEESTTIS